MFYLERGNAESATNWYEQAGFFFGPVLKRFAGCLDRDKSLDKHPRERGLDTAYYKQSSSWFCCWLQLPSSINQYVYVLHPLQLLHFEIAINLL